MVFLTPHQAARWDGAVRKLQSLTILYITLHITYYTSQLHTFSNTYTSTLYSTDIRQITERNARLLSFIADKTRTQSLSTSSSDGGPSRRSTHLSCQTAGDEVVVHQTRLSGLGAGCRWRRRRWGGGRTGAASTVDLLTRPGPCELIRKTRAGGCF